MSMKLALIEVTTRLQKVWVPLQRSGKLFLPIDYDMCLAKVYLFTLEKTAFEWNETIKG